MMMLVLLTLALLLLLIQLQSNYVIGFQQKQPLLSFLVLRHQQQQRRRSSLSLLHGREKSSYYCYHYNSQSTIRQQQQQQQQLTRQHHHYSSKQQQQQQQQVSLLMAATKVITTEQATPTTTNKIPNTSRNQYCYYYQKQQIQQQQQRISKVSSSSSSRSSFTPTYRSRNNNSSNKTTTTTAIYDNDNTVFTILEEWDRNIRDGLVRTIVTIVTTAVIIVSTIVVTTTTTPDVAFASSSELIPNSIRSIDSSSIMIVADGPAAVSAPPAVATAPAAPKPPAPPAPAPKKPLCKNSDKAYNYLRDNALNFVNKNKRGKNPPTIKEDSDVFKPAKINLQRIQSGLCLIESYYTDITASGKDIGKNKYIQSILPLKETTETFLSGTTFVLVGTAVTIATTKLLAVITTFIDFIIGLPSRTLGKRGIERSQQDQLYRKRYGTYNSRSSSSSYGGGFGGGGGLGGGGFGDTGLNDDYTTIDSTVDRRDKFSIMDASTSELFLIAGSGLLKNFGDFFNFIREVCERIDLIIGRYISIITSSYILFKMIHYQLFPDFPGNFVDFFTKLTS